MSNSPKIKYIYHFFVLKKLITVFAKNPNIKTATPEAATAKENFVKIPEVFMYPVASPKINEIIIRANPPKNKDIDIFVKSKFFIVLSCKM